MEPQETGSVIDPFQVGHPDEQWNSQRLAQRRWLEAGSL
jgi:hypothetical protein